MTGTGVRLLENRGDDRARWNQLVGALPESVRDLHYTPEYFDIYERTYGHAGALFVHETKGATLVQPFLKRPLDDVEGVDARGLHDVQSIYGYGGPLRISGGDPPSPEAYQESFRSFLSDRGFVSEYCMLHPFLLEEQKALLPADLALEYRKEVAYVDLGEPLDVLWSRIDERQRKAVATARRRGVVIRREDPTDAVLARFLAMYLETMRRKEAPPQWHFPESYFPNCRDCLGREGVSLFTASVGGTWAAAFFLLHRFRTAYYHFAASEPEFNAYNPTSLLLFDTILWARSAGYARYHMGGGRTDEKDDSLYRFKYSFAKRSAPLYVYKRALMTETFERLCRERAELERRKGLAPKPSRFFPPYRAPLPGA